MPRKIGTITPIWNQEVFLKPHFDMISKLDRNVVLMQKGPFPNYEQHGIGSDPDLSRYILERYFPDVEIYEAKYDPKQDFKAEVYNEGLRMMRDCDIVLRLDPDMFFTEDDFNKFIDLIQSTDFDSYHMDFKEESINYYGHLDFDHGLKDAEEHDALAINPEIEFTEVLSVPGSDRKGLFMRFNDGWMCHHLRGWNKPRSTPTDWWKTHEYLLEKYGNNGEWYKVPSEIRSKIESWLLELESLKKSGGKI